MAIAISVSMVLLFGEIIPQAVCARYGLQIGAYLNFLVLFLMVITFPISFPISLLLDKLLGKDHITFYRRSQLKSIIDIHGTSENSIEANGPLSKNEMQVIRGALDLQEMVIERLMRPILQTFMIDVDSKLDQKTIEQIQNSKSCEISLNSLRWIFQNSCFQKQQKQRYWLPCDQVIDWNFHRGQFLHL
jgi:metal transporter CNNM